MSLVTEAFPHLAVEGDVLQQPAREEISNTCLIVRLGHSTGPFFSGNGSSPRDCACPTRAGKSSRDPRIASARRMQLDQGRPSSDGRRHTARQTSTPKWLHRRRSDTSNGGPRKRTPTGCSTDGEYYEDRPPCVLIRECPRACYQLMGIRPQALQPVTAHRRSFLKPVHSVRFLSRRSVVRCKIATNTPADWSIFIRIFSLAQALRTTTDG
jgi:hypothetical protein